MAHLERRTGVAPIGSVLASLKGALARHAAQSSTAAVITF
jgi:hypothetical protein